MKNKIIYIGIIILVIVLSIVGILIYKNKTMYKQFNILDISDCSNTKCDKSFKFNKNILSIKYDNDNNYYIKLNDKEIFKGDSILILDKYVYTFDEMILFSISLNNNMKNILIFDTKGYQSVISKLVDPGMNLVDYKVDGTEVTLYGTRFSEKDEFIYGYSPDTLVKLKDCDSYTKYKDKMVAATYKINYANGKFSKIKMIESTNLEKYKDYSKLCEK